MHSRATGIADHLLPLGDLLTLSSDKTRKIFFLQLMPTFLLFGTLLLFSLLWYFVSWAVNVLFHEREHEKNKWYTDGGKLDFILLKKWRIMQFVILKRRGEIKFSIFDFGQFWLSRFWAGMTLFFIFTTERKELFFFLSMAPARGLYDNYFSSCDFLESFFMFLHYSNFPKNEEFC